MHNKWALGIVFSVIMVIVLLFMLPLISSLSTNSSIAALKDKLEQWGVYGYAIGALTDTRVPYVSAGNLADDPDLTFTGGNTLNVPTVNATTVGATTANVTTLNAPTGGTATITFAASNSATNDIDHAQYKCDGADDHLDIQAAINTITAVSGASPGVVLSFAPGVYDIDGNITTGNRAVYFVGAEMLGYQNRGGVRFRLGDTVQNNVITFDADTSHGGLYGITFDGSYNNTDPTGRTGGKSVVMFDNLGANNGDITVRKCAFFLTNWTYCIQAQCHNLWIEDCEFEENTNAVEDCSAINFNASYGYRVLNCHFRANEHDILINGGTTETWITGNTFRQNTLAGIVIGASKGTIANNRWINSQTAYGAIQGDASTTYTNWLICNNYFEGNSTAYFITNKLSGEVYNNEINNSAVPAISASVVGKISGNTGWITENSGTAVVPPDGSSTYVDVAHGLSSTPDCVIITPQETEGAGAIVPQANIGSSTFRLTIAAAVNPSVALQGCYSCASPNAAANRTNDTTDANDADANDVILMQAVPSIAATADSTNFAGTAPFKGLIINIGTQGAGTWTVTWQYWNGSTWAALSNVTDGTSAWTAAAGNHYVTWDVPTNWAESDATHSGGTITGYWVRALLTTYTSMTVQPLMTQAWIIDKPNFLWRASVGTGN